MSAEERDELCCWLADHFMAMERFGELWCQDCRYKECPTDYDFFDNYCPEHGRARAFVMDIARVLRDYDLEEL